MCSIDGCERKVYARSWCRNHYMNWWRGGSPHPRKKKPAAERFWAKVDKDGPGGCWLWTGCKFSTGYGQIKVDGRTTLAHRFAYELLIGPIPDGLTIDHLHARGCRHRHCVNPAHLEPVTLEENGRRAQAA